MTGRKQVLFMALLLPLMLSGMVERPMSRTQREIIDDFARLPVYAPGLVVSSESLDYDSVRGQSEALAQFLFVEESGRLAEFGFVSAPHLFLELAVRSEDVDQLPLFNLSEQLQSRLGITPNGARVSYNVLSPARPTIRTLAEQGSLSGLELLPGESIELKQLEFRLRRYDATRNIFILGAFQASLSSYLTELIAFLPEGMEQYQNQMEGLAYNQATVDHYLAIRETLIHDHSIYGLIPDTTAAQPQYHTLESTVLTAVDDGLLNPVSMWFAEFYDAYRHEDFKAARHALDEILEIDGIDTTQAIQPRASRSDGLLPVVLKSLAILCVFISVVFALIAIPTGKKAALVAVVFSAFAAAYHLSWMLIQYRYGDNIAWLRFSLLLNVFALLPVLGLIYYRAALVLGGVLLEAAIVLFQVHTPWLVGVGDSGLVPDWLIFSVFLAQIAGVFAVGVICQMLFGCAVIHYNSRVIDDHLLKLRQLMSVTLPLLRVAMIALLFSIAISVVLFRMTPGWYPFGYVNLACGLAILIQCSIFLQLRWINRLSVISLWKNHITLLILALFLLMSFGDTTLAYFPGEMLTRFSPLLKWTVFVVGAIVIITFYTIPAVNRTRQWIRQYRTYLKSHRAKKIPRSK